MERVIFDSSELIKCPAICSVPIMLVLAFLASDCLLTLQDSAPLFSRART